MIKKKKKLRTSAEESISLLTITPMMVQTTVLSKEGHTMSQKNRGIQFILCSQTEGHCAVFFFFLLLLFLDSVQNSLIVGAENGEKKTPTTRTSCSIFNLCFSQMS